VLFLGESKGSNGVGVLISLIADTPYAITHWSGEWCCVRGTFREIVCEPFLTCLCKSAFPCMHVCPCVCTSCTVRPQRQSRRCLCMRVWNLRKGEAVPRVLLYVHETQGQASKCL